MSKTTFQRADSHAFSFFHGADSTRGCSLPLWFVVFDANKVGVNFLALASGEPTDMLLDFQHRHRRKC